MSATNSVSTPSARADNDLRRWLLLAACIAAVLNFIAFYPGLLHHDAWAYFNAVREGVWTNWQPPLLGLFWIPLQKIYDGPQPMFVLFVAGYWAGFFLIADSLKHEGRRLAIFTFLAAFFPLALNFNGQLVKDIAMGVCLLISAGLAAGLLSGSIKARAIAVPLIWIFMVLGAFMRANSLFGLPPLIDLALRATSARYASMHLVKRAVIALVLATLVIPMHLFSDRHIFRVEDIKPVSPLFIFDLGGMTYFSGQDRFQGFFGPDFVERNAACYTPRHWDVYAWKVEDRGCPEVYEKLKPHFGTPLMGTWLRGIAADPIAYLTHRFAHANRFFQFLCADCKESVWTGWQSTNQKEFTFEPTFLYHWIEAAAFWLNDSPLGRPYVWLLIALAWAWAAIGIPDPRTRGIVVSIALAGAMYGLGFFIIGIAHEYRYIHFTMVCALLATPAVIGRVLMRSDAPAFYRVYPILLIAGVIALREAIVWSAL